MQSFDSKADARSIEFTSAVRELGILHRYRGEVLIALGQNENAAVHIGLGPAVLESLGDQRWITRARLALTRDEPMTQVPLRHGLADA